MDRHLRARLLTRAFVLAPLPRVIPRACFLDRRPIALRPLCERSNRSEQRVPQLGKSILHLGWNGRIHGPRHEAVALEGPQRAREHSLRDTFDGSAKIAEASRPV